MEQRTLHRTALICLIIVAYINGKDMIIDGDKVCTDMDPECTQVLPPCVEENIAQLCPKKCDLCNTSLTTSSVASEDKICDRLFYVDCYKNPDLIKRCPEYCTSTVTSTQSTHGPSTVADPESTIETKARGRTAWLSVMLIIPMIILTVIYAVKKKRECHSQQPIDMLSLFRSRLAITCTVRTSTSDSGSQTSSTGQSPSGHGQWRSVKKIFDRIVPNHYSSPGENMQRDGKEKQQLATASVPPDESVDHVALVYAKVDFTQVQVIGCQSSAKIEPTEYSAIDFQVCAK